MMGGVILIVSKEGPLFVRHLSVFLVFFCASKKVGLPPKKKLFGGKTWAGAPSNGNSNRNRIRNGIRNGKGNYDGKGNYGGGYYGKATMASP